MSQNADNSVRNMYPKNDYEFIRHNTLEIYIFLCKQMFGTICSGLQQSLCLE